MNEPHDTSSAPKFEVDLPPAERMALRRMAEQYGITPETLARLAISEKVTREIALSMYAGTNKRIKET